MKIWDEHQESLHVPFFLVTFSVLSHPNSNAHSCLGLCCRCCWSSNLGAVCCWSFFYGLNIWRQYSDNSNTVPRF
jgi:hypothetical protein